MNPNPTERMIAMLQEQVARLTAERDEARQQLSDIIQKKETQTLTILEEGNGVARVLFQGGR